MNKELAIKCIKTQRQFVDDLTREALDIAIDLLKQPERIRGRWIEKPHVHGVAYCSLCDYELHTNDTNFCPNCGADMRGDKDDESRSNSNAQTDTRARGMGATDKSSGI